MRKFWFVTITLFFALTLVACNQAKKSSDSDSTALSVQVGYFPNITHSQAVLGVARGDFQKALGGNVTLKPTLFNAGPAVIEALFAGEVDIAYIGPNPAINGYIKSNKEALRIVAGATSGGAALVVRPDANINSSADFAGKRLATPQLGNTQDVALRNYLLKNGLSSKENGGNVEIIPTQNSQILDLFRQGEIVGAWVPEPWATRLIVEGEGKLFLDERDLWQNGQFVTTQIIVRTKFLQEHPDVVEKFLAEHVVLTQWIQANPEEAQKALNNEIKALTGKGLADEVMVQAWSRFTPTWDPIASSLLESAESAHQAGFLQTAPDLNGIYDLTLLNKLLTAQNLPAIPLP